MAKARNISLATRQSPQRAVGWQRPPLNMPRRHRSWVGASRQPTRASSVPRNRGRTDSL